MELSVLLEDRTREDDPVLERLEEFTGLSYPELRVRHLREMAETFGAHLRSDRVRHATRAQMDASGRSFEEVVADFTRLEAHYRRELAIAEDELRRGTA